MYTKKEHVKALAKNVVSRLEQDEAIVLNPRTRQLVYQDLFLKLEDLDESGYTENEQYKAAKSVLMNKFAENAVAGLYYQRPVKSVAQEIGLFLMSHKQVEDVFPSDDELEKSIVEFLKRFNPSQLH
jgi:hypothetical protein